MTARKANLSDIDQIAKLFDAYRVFYEKESDLEACKAFLLARQQKDESVIFVAENADKTIVGFVQLYPLFSSTRMKRLWLLNDLFVDKDYRGQHFSVELIDAAKQWCINTEACALILETAKTNLIGNNLYKATGFDLDLDHHYYSWDVK